MSAVEVRPAGIGLRGALRVPGDKSIAHRALLLASVAEGRSRLRGLPEGADVAATREAVVRLGAAVRDDADAVVVDGAGFDLGAGCQTNIDCRNSGSTMRMVAGLVAARPGTITLHGDASLSRRPMERVARPLRAMGAGVTTTDGLPPMVVRGGVLHPIEWTPEVASAQVKSAILLAGLRTAGTTVVQDAAGTRDHTERLVGYLGGSIVRRGDRVAVAGGRPLRGRDVAVPGDPSSAAYWIVAATIVRESRVTLHDVCVNETRTGLLAILGRMGARIEMRDRREVAGEPHADLEVRTASLRGTTVGEREVPAAIDELPLLAVAAAFADGETVVTGAAELRAKESDRLAALEQLRLLGVDIDVGPDGFVVRGRPDASVEGGVGRAAGDHRIAMALAVAGLASRTGVRIEDADAVAISYPGFFDDLERLGGAAIR